MEDNKYKELRQQIEDKEKQIEILQNDIQELEETIEQYRSERFIAILEKTNTFVNKYYLDYSSYLNEIHFCYCKNISESHNGGIGIEYKCIEINQSNSIRFYETSTTTIASMEFFNNIIILNKAQAKEIYNEINKTICEEQTVKDLHRYLKELYNAEKVE